MKTKFEATLMPRGPGGAWTYLPIPFNVHQVFGTKARVAVWGTINGFAFRNSLMPEGDGTHSMAVSRELQAGAKARAGDLVRVVLQKDEEERIVTIPMELKDALRNNQKAASMFATLAPSHKKEYADWISTAEKQATKTSRAQKATEMLAEGKKRL